ncbi:hypothetical protein AGDE_13305 [Angomonas deanei]|nr:hypothetical protein AGDE_13305 [Angomonas deanei]|eukprot:EPY22510.1 hypothetical protein AGDE_13305 [Angomonas deanei]
MFRGFIVFLFSCILMLSFDKIPFKKLRSLICEILLLFMNATCARLFPFRLYFTSTVTFLSFFFSRFNHLSVFFNYNLTCSARHATS